MSKLQTRSILVVVLVLASLGLLGLNQSGSLGPVKGALLVPLTALQKWVAQTWNGAEALFQRSPDAEALRQRNAELEAENARLKAQAAAAAEDRATLSALSQLLDYARTQPENKYLAANVIGSSASQTRILSSSCKRSTNPCSCEAPPAMHTPLSIKSAMISGGVSSIASLMAATMVLTDDESASRTSIEDTSTASGRPVTRLRPRRVAVFSSHSGWAEPMEIFTLSAIRSPMSKLYLLRAYWMMS